jgi:hypothetical protein
LKNSTASGVEDVSVFETWKRLEADPKSVLVDVRTRAEWTFVGVPDLAKIGREVVLMEWQSFPDGRAAGDFTDRLGQALAGKGIGKDAEGFEGPLDGARHRSKVAGWKFAGLDWAQG